SLAEQGQLEEAQELLSRAVSADEDEDEDEDRGWGSSTPAHPPPLSPGSTRGAEAQAYLERHLFGGPEGSPSAAPLEVRLRPSEARWPSRLWLELQLKPGHTTEGRQTVQEVVACWFALGRLGAFNAANLQLQHATGPPSRARYETQGCGRRAGEPPALMHALSAWEADEDKGLLRVGVDLGSADPLALDCLISALETLSREVVGIASLTVGGPGEWRDEEDARVKHWESAKKGGAGEEEAGGREDVELPYDW
ncbi:hypothetical protein H632_c2241p1, partial [Helicosporidium sp. ATCC 50920]